MIHTSVVNAKSLSATEPLPEQSGTFLSVEIRADLRTSPETKAPSDNLRHPPHVTCFISLKSLGNV